MLLGEGRAQQSAQLLLVARRRQDEVGQLAQRREREHALVARAVLAHEAGPVDADDDRHVVLADVVDDLVEGALQEGRVERHEGPLAGDGQPGGQGHGVLLGDADVEDALRVALAEGGHAGAGGHAGRDGHDAVVLGRRCARARRP